MKRDGSQIEGHSAAGGPTPTAHGAPGLERGVSRETRARLEALAAEFGLPAGAPARFAVLLGLVATERSAITTVRDPAVAVDVHVADSLAGLRIDALAAADSIADVGSGAGFPGLVLAAARPGARVALLESVARKCAFLRRAAAALELANVEVVRARAESWRAGVGRHDVVTARAVAALPVLVEYAAPLLAPGGCLVAWKGRRDGAEEADGAAAAAVLGLEVAGVVRAIPRPGAAERHLHVFRKVATTPAGYPRREGMARKRPLGVRRPS